MSAERPLTSEEYEILARCFLDATPTPPALVRAVTPLTPGELFMLGQVIAELLEEEEPR